MPSVKLIYLTMHEDPHLASEAMSFRASGYLLKTSSLSELLCAIRGALKGRSYITPQIVRGINKSFICDPKGWRRRKSLTARHREIVQLLAEGKSMKMIADILGLKVRTVVFHKYNIMEKLGINSSAELIQFIRIISL